MDWISTHLDATWKRVLAAGVMSGLIVLAIGVFAESSYVQTQKIQQESARGQHCQKWAYHQEGGETRPTCAKWPSR